MGVKMNDKSAALLNSFQLLCKSSGLPTHAYELFCSLKTSRNVTIEKKKYQSINQSDKPCDPIGIARGQQSKVKRYIHRAVTRTKFFNVPRIPLRFSNLLAQSRNIISHIDECIRICPQRIKFTLGTVYGHRPSPKRSQRS